MSIISLLTDFGLEDPYVGIMKGVILSINPSARLVDITHNINPHDLIQAAFILKSSKPYFPEGTVHMVVVDPGVGSDRAIVALEISGQIFVAPDNGVLTLIIDAGDLNRAVRVENSDYFLEKVSRTFHGRDVFAPIAAHISMGVELNRLGTSIEKKDLVRLDIAKPFISEKQELVGSIVFIDRFGNCITDIDENHLEKFRKSGTGTGIQVIIGKTRINGLSRNYESAGPQYPLAIIGSFGHLEIAVNQGSAQQYFKVKKKDAVRVVLSPGSGR
ncbi:MAG: SAM-dependent chlorinase/fluorinase [Proteobacteria bacterium]|nr:SAM-dependent chlorinase/fluorinase [Pseudomonadota bacterium]